MEAEMQCWSTVIGAHLLREGQAAHAHAAEQEGEALEPHKAEQTCGRGLASALAQAPMQAVQIGPRKAHRPRC